MPHTIAENLTRLVNAKTAIGNAITAKGGTVGANDGLEEFATDIGTIPSGGGGSAGTSNVNFYDYDGTIVNSYSASEFAELTELPSNPTHEGLTAQGWNWTLAAAKTYVADYGALDIGQMYNTSDGKTRIHITLGDGRLEPYLGLGINGSVDVDWGDGSAHDTMTGSRLTTLVSQSHTYASEGDYVITIAVTGTIAFLYDSTKGALLLTGNQLSANGNAVYRNAISRINVGSNVTSISGSAFNSCYSLTSITIPSSVTRIDSSAFYNCYSLTSITIPSSVTSIGVGAFQNCYSLTSISIPSSATSIDSSAFYNCYSLTSITIPSSVTSIGVGAFIGCYSLTSITIPSSVTSIDSSAFQSCHSLTSITIPSSVTSIGSSAFYGCYSLTSISIPSSVTSIGVGAFQNCYSLTSISIPSSVTRIDSSAFQNCYSLTSISIPSSVTRIGVGAFNSCYSLTSITIPSSVTRIDSSAFYSCYGLAYIKFLGTTTIPTISNISAWGDIPSDCYILVPYDYLDDYLNTTNMPDDSTYLYLCYATYADGATLPTVDGDGYTLNWYATREDARAETNPISVGNGKEIYARGVEP